MALQRRLVALQQLIVDIDNRLDALEQHSPSRDRMDVFVSKQDTAPDCQLNDLGSVPRVQDLDSTTELRLANELLVKGITNYRFKRVPKHYYQEDLDYRCHCLQAASIQHLCKSLLYENPKMPEHGPEDFRYYLVIVQYAAKLHGEKVKRFLHKTNGKLGIQYFRPRQAPREISEKLSGYESGAVTPVGLGTPMQLILSHKIDQLQPDFFWMGGGEQLLKLGLSVHDFKQAYKPYVVDCTY